MRDFSLIFDALTTFETSLLEARLGAEGAADDDGGGDEGDPDGTLFLLRDPGSDADLRRALPLPFIAAPPPRFPSPAPHRPTRQRPGCSAAGRPVSCPSCGAAS